MTIEHPRTGEAGADLPEPEAPSVAAPEPPEPAQPTESAPSVEPATSVAAAEPVERAQPSRSESSPERRRTRRADRRQVEARQVTRVIRRVEPWSVFRVALVFSIALWLITVIAAVIIWQVARATGAIGHLESFLGELLADKSFQLDGAQLLRAAGISGLVLVVAGTGFAVLLGLLFNVISELTGGLRVSVIELETARRPVD